MLHRKMIFIIGCLMLIQFHLAAQVPQIGLETVATGFTRPVDIAHAGDNRLFIVEQAGIIKIIDSAGNVLPTPFLDIRARVNDSGNERGLLGLAFHPDYANNGYFYVNYTGSGGATTISRFSVTTTNPNIADPNSEQVLLTIPQPYSNHNGGCIKFGPDGYLYIGMGDGGSANDPQNNGQNPMTLLGKMLRIDVDTTTGYKIPPDNPFINNAGVLDEIWSLGWRNPWRFSFDRLTGDLYVADVGQNAWEEIDFEPANSPGGLNYGWRCYEGNHPLNLSGCGPQSSYVFPVWEYDHSNNNCSVTGGFVYRGNDYPRLQGRYFYSDYCSGYIWSLYRDSNGNWQNDFHGNFGVTLWTTFGEDREGELYIAAQGGTIYRIIDATPDPCGNLQTVVSALASKDTLCQGDTVQLDVTITGPLPGQCGTQGMNCANDTLFTVGNGTSVMPISPSSSAAPNPTPFFGYYTGARLQYLYRASLLKNAGLKRGTITAIGFNVATVNSTQPYQGFTIKMKCTATDDISGFESGGEVVYGPVSYSVTTGWNEFTLDSTFNWDGISNLLVEICFDNGINNWSSSDQVYYTAVNYAASYYDYSDTYGDECTLPGGTGANSQATSVLPNTRFRSCGQALPTQVSYAWSPATGLNDTAISNPMAVVNQTTTYTVTVTYPNGCQQRDSVTVIVEQCCTPPAFTSTTRITPRSARLNWAQVGSALRYVIRGRRIGTNQWTYLNVNTPVNFKDVFGLSNNTTYEWQVYAVCDPGGNVISGWSPLDTFTTGCFAPDSLWTFPVVDNAARLNWKKVYGSYGYEIKGRRLGGSWTTITIGNGNTTYRDVYGLLPGTTYLWTIRTYCSQNGNLVSPYATPDTFTTASGSRLAGWLDRPADNWAGQVTVFPNPVSDALTVQWDDNLSSVYFTLFNAMGEQVNSGIVNRGGQIDMTGLPEGIYMLQLNGIGKTMQIRIAVTHR